MAVLSEVPRQYVRTLTSGWRFTLPAYIRKERVWEEGTLLDVSLEGSSLVIRDEGHGGQNTGAGKDQGRDGKGGDAHSISCYLGAGGKMVIPAEIRSATGWSVGERLSIRNDERGVIISPCCPRHRCRSCGSVVGVREVIPNLYLCTSCWDNYVSTVNGQ